MNNFSMFCLSMEPSHLKTINELDYIPVGLGTKHFSKDWYTDSTGENISSKNKYYGEYTFHYWLWKNYLNKLKDGWIGFCQYRKFWTLEIESSKFYSLNQLKNLSLRKIPINFDQYDVILGEETSVENLKTMKFLKKSIKLLSRKPSYIFNLFSKNKRNIKFHFDLMHGYNNLNKAIDLLDDENKKDFNDYVNSNVSFNPHNMFICKSKKILKNYYSVIFPWLNRCEKLFGFENLKTFGQIRIYTFLAERFMSYWFQKNTKTKTMPIVFYDIRKDIK